MKNLIAITAGEPESINSEIIAKTWNKIRFKNKLLILEITVYLKINLIN